MNILAWPNMVTLNHRNLEVAKEKSRFQIFYTTGLLMAKKGVNTQIVNWRILMRLYNGSLS